MLAKPPIQHFVYLLILKVKKNIAVVESSPNLLLTLYVVQSENADGSLHVAGKANHRHQ
jgi:hypothetical protein